jgi:hypothetical protein
MEKQKLPNGTAVIILGILSIVTCCCYGILGLILGVVAIVLANKDAKLYNEKPELYSNYSNIKTGKILAYIGIVLSVLYLIYIVWIFSVFGMETLQDPQLLQEKIKEMMGQ